MTVFHLVQHAEKHRGPGDPAITELGELQATEAAEWLWRSGVQAVLSSPQRRARETARAIASRTGLPLQEDPRLRERMNWDGSQPMEEFLEDWMATTRDRDFVPSSGDSSRQAAERMKACLHDLIGRPGPVSLVTHGGVTVDLLRTLLGDDMVPITLVQDGIPPCAITTLNDLSVVSIASVSHLTSKAL
ncbi:histidine phosphatase family protein [Nonomuraea sp. NPDC050536]|uniref:histidine phosphatase family protein n=1 Tax=Nonomuraea sp. NPDC050536 TaxID=3364366 RepID=UPI0037C52E36